MKKITTTVIFALVGVASFWLFSNLKWVDSLNYSAQDFLIRYFSPATSFSEEIVLVLLDESTMKELPYRSPVPRDFLQRLNERILAGRPKLTGYDIFFKDPTIAGIDNGLATSFKKGNTFSVSAGRPQEDGSLKEDLPLPIFMSSLKGVGLSDLPFSAFDSTVRSARFMFDIGGTKRPSFVADIFEAFSGTSIGEAVKPMRLMGFNFSPFEGDEKSVRIRFATNDDEIKAYPAKLVADGLVPSDWFTGKIVLVGASYDDGTDAYITPLYSVRNNFARMPGVKVHANVLNQLLTGQYYYFSPKWMVYLKMAFFSLICSILFIFGSQRRSFLAFVGLALVIIVSTLFWFAKFSILVPVVSVLSTLIFIFAGSLGWRSLTEGRQKRFIRSVFAKYVPPAVVDKMIADPSLLTLGGEVREVTSMFTDIASFTSVSERLDPKRLVEFLNDYLDRLTKVIFKYGGTLDKYEGDAIIAFFGAPLPLPEHKKNAILAAIEMEKESAAVSEKWKDVCGREIITRIGLNSGRAVVGNMGSLLRFDYTAIGDTINLASRLEGANKFFDTRILASESVVLGLGDGADILYRSVARLKVKGKSEAVEVFEVGGLKGEQGADFIKNFLAKRPVSEIVELTSK